MRRFAWQLRQALEHIGWQGVLGIMLLTVSGVLAATVLPSRISDLDRAQSHLETLRARLLLAGPDSGRGSVRDDQLANFYAFFPPLTTLPDWLERIFAAAEKNGVQLDTGEYKLLQETKRKLARYQMTLPVRGSYAQVRSFIADVLTEVPAAALDDVGFRREAVGNSELDTRIRFTLYMGTHK